MTLPRVQKPPFEIAPFDKDGRFVEPWRLWFLAATAGISTGAAPADAQYLVSTADALLSAERNLGLLASGYLKIITALGIATPSSTPTIPTGDLTGTLGSGQWPAILYAADGSLLTNLNAGALASGTVPAARLPFVFDFGAYLPTLFNTVNIAASTAFSAQYLRLGSVVTVSGQVNIDPTAAGDTQLGISLPVASNLANANELAGTAFSPVVAEGAALFGDAANDRATLEFQAVSAANNAWFFTMQYRVN